MSKEKILDWVDNNEETFSKMAKEIWDNPQIAYEEAFAADVQMKELEKNGFTINPNIANIPTAFAAEYGSGKPIIGILGEFDALPGLSQEVSPIKEEIVPDGPGHGCGHNLLGTAGVKAVIALKERMEQENLPGTIRYYGCPAEEVLSGKTYMARAGVFDDLDCSLTWHPGKANLVANLSMQAIASIKYRFHGITAHAAAAPHAGRSALEAVELMNNGVNQLRERILDGFRMHYVITDGGLAPNVVPETAEVWYYLRADSKKDVEYLLHRVNKIAEGAALMTETSFETEVIANAYEILPNDTLSELMFHSMNEINDIEYDEKELHFADELVKTVDPEVVKTDKLLSGGSQDVLPKGNLYFPELKGSSQGGGSTDAADVSWIAPMGMITTTCAPVGVQLHSWQATASFGSTIGFKGMHQAAKAMAIAAYDLIQNKDNVLDKAKEEFIKDTKDNPYAPGIPEDVQPPIQN